ncbi:GpE family phage tail protein [Pseudogemmobacter blasticus]|uniref:GpE family phage tail protein n=1 Tax=Fuscovulum blasticum DSM 2131 TaxID=1188250 RepID=A0A2T4JDC6_FUSBL|nr:GpE family phage tail protein [Fuscovulum blasticum]PTE15909.1 GpE family phage tail protein [Fuscovulum blasticum DSM 2131]
MADIAVVFHWPPQAMDPMTLDELARWWGKARARAGREDADG